jgi:hypothetical protein
LVCYSGKPKPQYWVVYDGDRELQMAEYLVDHRGLGDGGEKT